MKTIRLYQVLALLSALFCLFVLMGEAHALSFGPPADYAAGDWSLSGTTGDFNGDGIPDLAVANYDSDNVSILLGKGDGTFNTAVNYAAGDSPHGLVTGDFNRDGNLDIAVTNYVINKVSVLLGNGDGTFGAPANYAAGSNPGSITTGDFNGDGMPDLAVADYGSGNVSILLGDGNGAFATAVDYGAGSYPCSIITGDFNRDGNLDLAVANHTITPGSVSILLGVGNGTFNAAVSYVTGNEARSVISEDFNRDGIPDLAVANYVSSDVSILIGAGDGTFNASVNYDAGSGASSNPFSVVAGDFDGDGKLDLAVADNWVTGVWVLTGNGDGTFNAAVNIAASGNLYSIITGDFNRDGRPDLAMVTPFDPTYESVSVLLNTTDFSPSGIINPPVNYPAGVNPMWVIEADFNRDGISDLAVPNFSNGTLSILIGKGDGTFYAAVNYAAGTRLSYGMTAGDFNGDCIPDLAVTDLANSSVSILIGKGDGTFGVPVSYAAGSEPFAITAADFNRDGRLDLAVTNYSDSGTVSVLFGNGDGTFSNPADYATGGSHPTSEIMGDFNGDGIPDLAVANNTSGTVSVLLGNGDGTFIAAVSYSAGTHPITITAGDFNRDGIPDLAVANFSSNNVSVFIGKGDGTFYTAVNYGVQSGPRAVTAGDFNRDGKIDLAAASSSGLISILNGKGDGTFYATGTFDSSIGAVSITAGDFNRDGKIDLAVASTGGNVSILLNSPATSNLTVTKTGTGTGSVITDPAGTDCGTDCRTFDNGTLVTLTATVDAGSTFGGWTGCTPDLLDPLKCTITMNANSEVEVAFNSIIAVTSPNGGETWAAGDKQTVQWTYIGNPGAYVKIELLKAGVLNRTLASYALKGTGGVGSFTFTLPSSQTPGSDYTVRITSRSNVVYTDTSDNPFTINAPTITVASPNGGETWDAGTTQTVSWTYTGNPGSYVRIELFKGGVYNRTIALSVLKGTGGVGSYSFKVPYTLTQAGDYTVMVTSTSNSAYTYTSDPFTINPPTITVSSPDGGESWAAGTTQTVSWTYTLNPGAYVRIELLKGGVLKRVLTYGVSRGAGGGGFFNWPIPSNLTLGADYAISITSTTNPSIGDTGGSFTISP